MIVLDWQFEVLLFEFQGWQEAPEGVSHKSTVAYRKRKTKDGQRGEGEGRQSWQKPRKWWQQGQRDHGWSSRGNSINSNPSSSMSLTFWFMRRRLEIRNQRLTKMRMPIKPPNWMMRSLRILEVETWWLQRFQTVAGFPPPKRNAATVSKSLAYAQSFKSH